MNFGKIIKNKRNLVIGIVLVFVIMIMLTGCEKADESVKTYDKEKDIETSEFAKENNVNQSENSDNQNKNSNNQTAERNESNKVDEANEVIRKALKDISWLKNNIFKNDSIYKLTYGDDYTEKKPVFAKISGGDSTMYIIGIVNPSSTEDYFLINYKDGKVTCKEIPKGDYDSSTFDLNNNVVKTEGSVGGTKFYAYKDGEYVKIAEIIEDVTVMTDDNMTYEIDGKLVSPSEMNSFEKKYNFVEIKTELTNENIDKYVK